MFALVVCVPLHCRSPDRLREIHEHTKRVVDAVAKAVTAVGLTPAESARL